MDRGDGKKRGGRTVRCCVETAEEQEDLTGESFQGCHSSLRDMPRPCDERYGGHEGRALPSLPSHSSCLVAAYSSRVPSSVPVSPLLSLWPSAPRPSGFSRIQ